MTADVKLRPVQAADLDAFFQHQLDREARRQAAFVTDSPEDRARFDAHWARVLADTTGCVRTVLADGVIAGHVLFYLADGRRELSYWIDRAQWGRGIASAAVAAFIAAEVPGGMLHARVVQDHLASLKVLQRCGFRVCGRDTGYAAGRGEQVDEFLLERPARPFWTAVCHQGICTKLRHSPAAWASATRGRSQQAARIGFRL